MALNLKTLKVGDKVERVELGYGNRRLDTVEAIGPDWVVARKPNGTVWVIEKSDLKYLTKVEPPLINPEKVWHLRRSGTLSPTAIHCHDIDVAAIRITSYEIVKDYR